jgi:hypothetical protein
MKPSSFSAINDSYIIFRYVGLKIGWLGSKIFKYGMKKNYSGSKNLIGSIIESLPKKESEYFIKMAKEKNIYEPLKEEKSVLEVLCTDPETGQLCFGMIGNIVDLVNVEDKRCYGPFFGKKLREVIKN